MSQRRLTYGQFLPMWMRLNNVVVLFFAGEAETRRAYLKYRRTSKIPKQP